MVSSIKIAEVAGVSRSTVQRALSGDPNVAVKTREKALHVARTMGYTPNKTAKALVMRQQKLEYGVIFGSNDNPFYDDVLNGIMKAREELKEFGITVDVRFMGTVSTDEQIALIQKMVKEGKKGIVFTPIDCDEVRAEVNRAKKMGTDFVAIATDLPRTPKLCYIGQANHKCGRVAGGLMNILIRDNEKIACIIGSKNYLAHQERLDGFLSRFYEQHSKTNVVAILENNDHPSVSENLMRELLAEIPDLRGVFVAGAGVEGVCKFIEEAGLVKQVKIICFDLTEERVAYCRRGVIDFVIDQQGFWQGYKALTMLNEYVMFDDVPEPTLLARIDIRTRDNVDM